MMLYNVQVYKYKLKGIDRHDKLNVGFRFVVKLFLNV